MKPALRLVNNLSGGKGAALIAALFLLGGVLVGMDAWNSSGNREEAIPTAAREQPVYQISFSDRTAPESRPSFKIDRIDGIEVVIASAAGLTPEGKTETAHILRGVVLPHHTLAAPSLVGFWQEIAAKSKPSVIVIVGANHDELGQGQIQSAIGTWQTPLGPVLTDDGVIADLFDRGTVTLEPDSFANEHSIGSHATFIAKVFPGVKIVPIIVKSTAGSDLAHRLVNQLAQVLPKDALLLSSIDFSHYLPVLESRVKDEETLRAINQFDLVALDRFKPDHLDSSLTIELAMLWGQKNGCQLEEKWRGDSSLYTKDESAPGTTYFVFFCQNKEPRPLTLAAVGDIMLARGVGEAIRKQGVDKSVAGMAGLFDDSDIVFGNLESVFSAKTALTCAKPYCFRADPGYVDILKRLRVSVVSVANNHNYDFGRADFDESLTHLSAAGIKAAGGYVNANVPAVLEAQGKKFVFLAFDAATYTMKPEQMAALVAKAPAHDYLVVSFHWGEEYEHLPTQNQINLAHAVIDAGADMVIGHHPHVLQGIEKYKNGIILYSLGNFYFDQIGQDQNESLAVKFRFGKDKTLELEPVFISNTFPAIASSAQRELTLGRLAGWSGEGIREEIKTGVVRW